MKEWWFRHGSNETSDVWVQEEFGQCPQAPGVTLGVVLELALMILMGVFQLRITYDFMVLCSLRWFQPWNWSTHREVTQHTERPLALSAWGQLTEYSFTVASPFSPVKGEIPACYETSAILSTFWNIQQHTETFSCAVRQVRSPHISTEQINEPRWGIWWQKQIARVPLNKVTQRPSQVQEFINSLSRLSL